MAHRVTLSELGKMLGLDKSSISLALRNSPKISPATRERVQQAARRHGYQPNLAARQLNRYSRPQVVTLVLPHSLSSLSYSQPVATIRTLSQTAVAQGFVFNILSSQDIESIGKGSSTYPLLPDGTFVWGDVAAQVPELLGQWRIPTIVLDPNHMSYEDYAGTMVRIDNYGGAAAVVQHLLERGVKRLLFVDLHASHLGHQQRQQGAKATWLTARSAASLQFCSFGDLTDQQLRRFAKEPDGAIFCVNDRAAMQLWHRLISLGVTVPSQVRLAGFDGDEYGQLVGLTTAIFESEGLALAGWKALVAAMDGHAEPHQETIRVTLHIGATT